MKKLLSFLALAIFAVGITGCFSSETTLEFVTLPDSIYELVGESGEIDLSKVEVRIDGLIMNLNQAIANGAIVTGNTFTSAGLHTLTIKYKTATISYNYIVNEEGIVDENEYEIDWYDKDAPKGTTFHISSANDLRGLAAIVNGTAKLGDETLAKDDFDGDTIVLDADIDLTDSVWTPIAQGPRKYDDDNDPNTDKVDIDKLSPDLIAQVPVFRGTFDGRGHTIIGLSDIGYTPSVAQDYRASNGDLVTSGYTFGLFGIVSGITVKNLKMSNVRILGVSSINLETGEYIVYNGDSIGAVAGLSYGSADNTFENIEILSGTIIGFDAVAGIIGRNYQKGGTLRIIDCVNYANITATRLKDVKVAGLVSISNAAHGTGGKNIITGCSNYGTISTLESVESGHIGAIFAQSHILENLTSTNNSNFGVVKIPEGFTLDGPGSRYVHLYEFNPAGSKKYKGL